MISSSVASEKRESHLNSKARGFSNKGRGIRIPSSSTNETCHVGWVQHQVFQKKE